MADDLEVRVGAETDDAEAGVRRVVDALENLVSPISTVENAFARLKEVIVGTFVVHEIESFIESMAELGTQVERTSAMLGLGKESVLELGSIAKLTGGDLETMTFSAERLERNMAMATQGNKLLAANFEALGISTSQLKGYLTGPGGLENAILALSDKFAAFPDGVAKTTFALSIGSRGFAQWIPLLDMGSVKLKSLMDTFRDTSAEIAAATPKMEETHFELVKLDAAWEAFKVRLFVAVQPAVDMIIGKMTELLKHLTSADIKNALVNIGEITLDIITTIGNMVLTVDGYIQKLVLSLNSVEAAAASGALGGMMLGGMFGGPGGALIGAGIGSVAGALVGMDPAASQAEIDANIATARASFNTYMDSLKSQLDKMMSATGNQGVVGAAVNGIGGGTGKAPGLPNLEAMQRAEAETKQFATAILGYANAINGEMNTMIRGLITGTTTFKDAFRKLLQDLVMDFITACERMVERWLIMELFKTSTTATQTAIRDAISKESNAGDIAGMIEKAMTAITSSAQQTFAGATAWFSPTLGPAAPAAGAGVAAGMEAAAVAGLPSFDIGTYSVPRTGPAVIHEGEMILPKSISDIVRGGSSGEVHLHVHAVDADSVRRFFEKNGEHIAHAMKTQFRNYHPALR